MTRPTGLAPLRHRAFRLLAGGQLASNVGDAFYAVALPWYVLAHHGGALLLGTVLAAYGVPRTVFLAVGGHASDRWRPWTVMLVADAVRALAVAAFAAVALAGPASAIVLVPVAVLLGAGEGFFLPGSFSIVPSLLPDEELQAGNALTSGGTQLAALAGPAVGGLVVALAGPGPAFAVDAATFAISAVTLAAIRVHQTVPVVAPALGEEGAAVAGAGAGVGTGVGTGAMEVPASAVVGVPGGSVGGVGDGTGDGVGAAGPTLRSLFRSERVLQLILLVTLAANLGMGGSSEVALPALAHGPFHTGAGGYGGLIAAFGGGALAGTLLAAQGRRLVRPAVVASVGFLLEGVLMGAIPYLGGLLAAGAALVVIGALNGFGNIVTITAFQRWAPPALMGRLMGLLMLGSLGAFPVSVAVTGVIVRAWGPAVFFPLASVLLVAAVVVGLTQPSWREFGAEGALPATSRREPAERREPAGGREPAERCEAPEPAYSTKMQNGWPEGSA